MAELLSQSIRHTPKSLKLRPTHIRIFPVRKSNGVKGSPLSWEVASQWMNRQRFSSSLSLFLDPWERRERERERGAITEAIAYKKETWEGAWKWSLLWPLVSCCPFVLHALSEIGKGLKKYTYKSLQTSVRFTIRLFALHPLACG